MKKSSSTNKGALWLAMIAMIAMIAFVGCPAEQTPSGLTNENASHSPVSLDAPELKGESFDGVNYVTWKPVKNATGYRLYRDNKFLRSFSKTPADYTYDESNLEYYDYASLSSKIESIKDGHSYTYTVVATGVQVSRSNDSIVLTDADILGDSRADITLTAKVPAVFSKVKAAEKVNAAYMDDIARGKVMGIYFEKPSYLYAGIRFAHDETGSGVNFYEYLTAGYQGSRVDALDNPKLYFSQKYISPSEPEYAWTPAYGGKYKYQVVTYWPNSFYKSNEDVSGDIEIPSLVGENVPKLTATAVTGGIKLTWTDTAKATYTLYRADDTDESKAWSFTKIAGGNDFVKTECGSGNVDYVWTDTKNVTYGKYYVYVLTATKDGKALNFNSSAPAVAFAQYNTAFTPTTHFAAINVAGTVSLSWDYDKDLTYKVLKCSVDYPYNVAPTDVAYNSANETKHVETTLTPSASNSNISNVKNGVLVMTDSIDKVDNYGYYKYKLIVTNKEGATYTSYSEYITGYYKTGKTFSFTVVGGKDTDGNGIYDKVELSITSDSTITATPTFYRAEVDGDTVSTSAGAAEFITKYDNITPELKKTVDNGNGTKTYTYWDNLTEEKIATIEYVYAAVATQDKITYSGKGLCALCDGAIVLPDITFKQTDSSGTGTNTEYTYKLTWNAEYAKTIKEITPPDNKLTPSAAVVKFMTAYSNNSINNVKDTEWNTTVIKASDFTDYTYLNKFTVGKKESDKKYFYARVLFTNASHKTAEDVLSLPYNYKDLAIGNPAYTATSVSHITKIVGAPTSAQLYTTNNTTSIPACVIGTDGTLAGDKYTVYVTWLHDLGGLNGYEILESPKSVTLTKVSGDYDHNKANGYYEEGDHYYYYFGDTPASTISSNTDAAMVHVYNTDGEALRSVIVTEKWW